MSGSFEVASEPPPEGSKLFLPDQWDLVRDSGIVPLNQSALADDPAQRAEFVDGLGLLRLYGARQRPDAKLVPQNLRVADVVNAGNEFTAVLMPRRSSKTTSLFAVALGRCANREGYLASYTMMTRALKARDRFYADIVEPLEYLFPDKKTSPWKIVKAGGREQVINLDTGSRLVFVAPKGESFRSDAWDMVILDEAGEASPEATVDILAGSMSTMDSKDGAQLIVAGTAAKYRKGNLLWDQLEEGRAGVGGIIEYAAPPSTTAEEVSSWDQAAALAVAGHPGIGSLTTLEKVESRWRKQKPEVFMAEYLSIFGEIGSAAFIDQVKWDRGRQEGSIPTPPERFTMAFAVHLDATVASIVAAWRDDDGRAKLLVLYNGPVRGLHAEAVRLSAKYRATLAYDKANGVTDGEAKRLERQRPRPRLMSQGWPEVSTSAAQLLKEIEAENVDHWDQGPLTGAVRVAVKRGQLDSKRWSFGRPKADMEADITALEAGMVALSVYDSAPPKAALRPVSAA